MQGRHPIPVPIDRSRTGDDQHHRKWRTPRGQQQRSVERADLVRCGQLLAPLRLRLERFVTRSDEQKQQRSDGAGDEVPRAAEHGWVRGQSDYNTRIAITIRSWLFSLSIATAPPRQPARPARPDLAPWKEYPWSRRDDFGYWRRDLREDLADGGVPVAKVAICSTVASSSARSLPRSSL